MADFTMTLGDTLPDLTATLTDQTKAAANLTGAIVQLVLRRVGASSGIARNATVVDAAVGQVRYTWQDGDIAVAGHYAFAWRVTWADGKVLTFPNGATLLMVVHPPLD